MWIKQHSFYSREVHIYRENIFNPPVICLEDFYLQKQVDILYYRHFIDTNIVSRAKFIKIYWNELRSENKMVDLTRISFSMDLTAFVFS